MNTLRLVWLFFRVGAMNELQYRINFFVQVLQSLVALGTGLVGLWLVFSHTVTLNGWAEYELLALMGIHILMGGLIQTAIQPNMARLMTDIREGTLDYALTKPEDSQVLISVRETSVWKATDIVLGFIVLGFAVYHLHTSLGLVQAVSFAAVLFFGALMIYSFWLILTTTAFWFVKVDEIVNLLDGVYAAGRYPVSIYPNWLRYGLTFLVPVAFAVTVPAEAMTGRLTTPTLLGAAALALVFLAAARWLWRRGLRHYSGASA